MICPAEFDTGAAKNVMILSVPEGHDKPLKYPLMFSKVDALIINKIDVMPYFDFDMAKVREYVEKLNKKIVLIDGSTLAQFMIEYNVGVSTKKVYEIKRIDSDYFEE